MDNEYVFLAWLFLIVYFIASPINCLIICTLGLVSKILDYFFFDSIKLKNNKPTIIQTVIINSGKLNVDEMIVYPTVEQFELKEPCLKPTINLEDEAHNSPLTPQGKFPSITIELRKPTIDQLLCYPTVEQYHLKNNILKPTVYYRAYHSSIYKSSPPSELSPTIVVQFGKPL
ncbi:hypothetical protein CDAR_61711 [Caerostris darwini]|uniref:Uncharacterized protein n=1 Tax=Caerostris darwini TaxID=1538125 RepID=A0AAV4VKD8_9ARAC|nr:hypothetical protein CDAR_61711 [Caerostris darwini]